MTVFNIHEAKTNFSKLVDAVGQGDEIIIAKAGKPAARLIPIQGQRGVRRPGALTGKIRVADDFDAPLQDDLQKAFEGD